MKSHVSKEEMKKRNDKDILAEKEMLGEGGTTSKNLENDPRINDKENLKQSDKENKK